MYATNRDGAQFYAEKEGDTYRWYETNARSTFSTSKTPYSPVIKPGNVDHADEIVTMTDSHHTYIGQAMNDLVFIGGQEGTHVYKYPKSMASHNSWDGPFAEVTGWTESGGLEAWFEAGRRPLIEFWTKWDENMYQLEASFRSHNYSFGDLLALMST